MRQGTTSHGSAATITSIAVLPFKPLVAADRDPVTELGIADTLIGKLSSSRRLVVRSINSVRRFDSLDQDPVAAGQQLGVGAVLEGQLQKRGDLMHVSARLLAVPGGTALWTGTYDANQNDVFAMQDTIAEHVARALSLELGTDERRAMVAKATRDPEAYRLYLHRALSHQQSQAGRNPHRHRVPAKGNRTRSNLRTRVRGYRGRIRTPADHR